MAPRRWRSWVAQAPNLLNKLTQIADNLNGMLNAENAAALTDTLTNLRDLSVGLKSHEDQINTLLNNGNVAVSNFSEAGASLKGLAEQLNKSAGAMTSDARKAVQSFDQMSSAFKQTADQLNGLITDNRGPLEAVHRQRALRGDRSHRPAPRTCRLHGAHLRGDRARPGALLPERP